MFKRVERSSIVTCFLLAFIAMVGTSYLNFLPGVLSALAGGIGLSQAQAGELMAINGYGALVGSTVATFLVRRVAYRPLLIMGLALLGALDLGTVWLAGYKVLLAVRFIAGLAGGMCMGLAFAALARLNKSDLAFGALLFIQFTIGALVMRALPALESLLSAKAVFYVMAILALISLLCAVLIPEPGEQARREQAKDSHLIYRGNVWLLLLAIAGFNCSAGAIWAYAELIAADAQLPDGDIAHYLALTSLLGLVGALFPMLFGARTGRLPWVITGMLMSCLSSVLLMALPVTPTTYIVAMGLLFLSWTAVLSYLLAVAAELDISGRLSSISAVVSLAGTASGPLLGASLLHAGALGGRYSFMLCGCALLFLACLFFSIRPVRALDRLSAPLSLQRESLRSSS